MKPDKIKYTLSLREKVFIGFKINEEFLGEKGRKILSDSVDSLFDIKIQIRKE